MNLKSLLLLTVVSAFFAYNQVKAMVQIQSDTFFEKVISQGPCIITVFPGYSPITNQIYSMMVSLEADGYFSSAKYYYAFSIHIPQSVEKYKFSGAIVAVFKDGNLVGNINMPTSMEDLVAKLKIALG